MPNITPDTLHAIEYAKSVAEVLNFEDDDWTYEAVAFGPSMGAVAVYDDERILLGYL